MREITRSGASVFPSGLTGKVYRYAKEGKGATAFGDAWLGCAGDTSADFGNPALSWPTGSSRSAESDMPPTCFPTFSGTFRTFRKA